MYKDVTKLEIEKPLYNKLRVTSLNASVVKQNDIKEVLTFTASVERYENDAWVAATQLTAGQEAQLQCYFIKNNDENDKDIITDNPTNDNITINGLEMSVNLEEDNIFKIGHAHCYVVDAQKEGYDKRYLKVEDIIYSYPKQEEAKCIAILNVEEPREDELAQIRWNIEGKHNPKYDSKTQIIHNLKDEKVYEINFQAYIKDKIENVALAMVVYDENV